MHLHANAKLTPALHRLLVYRVRELGSRITEAAEAVGVSRQSAYKWLSRYDAEGEAGPENRSCLPHRLRRQTGSNAFGIVEIGGRQQHAMAWYFELIRTHGVDVTPISSHRFRLEQYAEASTAGYEQGARDSVKMLFTFD